MAPKLTDEELRQVAEEGINRAGVEIDADVVRAITAAVAWAILENNKRMAAAD